jgi:sugar O-acyltransferase (sialic acid O-acetyltransferase NeuD family)
MDLIMIGMGGHSKVAADVAVRQGYRAIKYVDDHPQPDNGSFLCTLQEFVDRDDLHPYDVFIAIGSNSVRKRISHQLKPYSIRYATLIDPSATVSPYAEIMEGTLVMPGAVINASAKIGRHVIVNTSATVDHDCLVEDFVHLSPGVHLAGSVTVHQGAHLGIGCVAAPSVTIGANSIVGAGAVVVKHIPPNVTSVGVPAKTIKFHLSKERSSDRSEGNK